MIWGFGEKDPSKKDAKREFENNLGLIIALGNVSKQVLKKEKEGNLKESELNDFTNNFSIVLRQIGNINRMHYLFRIMSEKNKDVEN